LDAGHKYCKLIEMETYTKSSKKELYILLAIFTASILIRIIYLWQYYESPFWGNLTVDAKYHYLWAKSISSGDFWGSEVFFRAPLYPYFLAFQDLIFSGNLLAILIVQNIIGLASFLLVYRLSRNLFGIQCALITAILYLFTFDFVFFESELLLDFLLVLFLPLIFISIFSADRSGKRWYWYIAGLLIGLAIITRPTTIILLALIPLFYLSLRSKLFRIKNWAINTMLLFTGLILILLPIAIRNASVGDEFTALPTQGGINFYIGNNPHANGWSAAMPPPLGAYWQYADCRQIAEKDVGHELKPSQVSNYWMKQGLNYLADSPNQALKLMLKKAYLLMYSKPISNNRNISDFKDQIGIGKVMIVSWWLIFPFGLLGMILSLKHNLKARLIIFFIILYSIILVLFFVTSRFRLPLYPFWIIFAAYGMTGLYNQLKQKSYKWLIVSLFLVVAGSLSATGMFYKIPLSSQEQILLSDGNRLFAAGDYATARDRFQQIISINPAFPQANMNIGAAFVKNGQLDSAEYYYHQELTVNPDSALTLTSLAEIARLHRDSISAMSYAMEALELKPHYVEVFINYVKAARNGSRQADALKRIKPIERYYTSNPYYYFYRGVLKIDLASVNLNYLSEAEKDFQNALKLLKKTSQPTYERDPSVFAMLFSDEKRESLIAKSHANIGVIKLASTEYTNAVESFQTALKYDPDLYQASSGLLESLMRMGEYERALELLENLLPKATQDELLPFTLYYAQAHYNLGKIKAAETILEELLNEYPDYLPAQRILEAIKKGG
jgi:4-amino-4-deoxy-L-arabinose transferase-like glycosyltransferase